MANLIYPKYKEAMLKSLGDTSLEYNDVRVAFIDVTEYTYDPSHEFFSDLTGVLDISVNSIQNKTFVGGLFDGDGVGFPLSDLDALITGLVIYIDTGFLTTSRLVLYADDLSDFPLSSSGNNIAIDWNPAGIFQL
jgi:hypothetical protein